MYAERTRVYGDSGGEGMVGETEEEGKGGSQQDEGAVVAQRRTHAQQSVMVDTGEVCHESWQHVNASRKKW